jgi:HlyD family secretion protein
MKKNAFLLIIIVILIATAAVVIFNYRKAHAKIDYITAVVDRGTIENIVTSTGELQPVTKVEIGSQVSGKIISLYVDYNTRVRKGQAIAEIDTSLYQSKVNSSSADLQQARANYAEAEANYRNALINVKLAETDIETAMAEVKNSEASLNKAKSGERSSRADIDSAAAKMKNSQAQMSRYLELYKNNYVSQTDRDKMETDYLMDKASHESMLAKYRSSHDGVESAQAQLAQARSKLQSAQVKKISSEVQAASSQAKIDSALARQKSAQSGLNEARINLNYCTITSPIDGVVISKDVEVGQTVQASFQTPKLLTLAKDLSKMQITANVDEADIDKVRLGQAATFSIEAYSSEIFEGKVVQVRSSSKSTQGVVTYGTIVRTENKDNKFKPGMTATVSIVTSRKENVLRIPTRVLRFKPESITGFPYPKDYKKENGRTDKPTPTTKEIWVLRSGNRPEPVIVNLGLSERKFVQVLGDTLKEGDKLIIGSSGTAGAAAK